MRIVFYSYDLNRIAGIERGIIRRANELAARGHEVYILDERDYDSSRELLCPLSPAVKVVDFSDLMHRPHNLRINLKGIVRAFRYFKAVDKWLKAIKPDILISRGEECCRTFHIVRHHGASYIMEFAKTLNRNEFKPRLIDRFIMKFLCFRVDKYVVLTHLDLKYYNGPKDKIAVIHNPLYITPQRADVENSKIIISTGRLHPEKNYEMLIEAFAPIVHNHPDWHLHIYGDGERKEFLQDLIDKLNVSDNVKLMGRTNNITHALSSASIFALTSINEGLSNSVIEAIACGIPVIVADVNGNQEIMDNYEVGYIVPQGDTKAFSERMSYLIEHPLERIRLGENGIKRSQDFDFSTIISKQEQLFEDLRRKKH